jgi:hypothetical protein
MMSLDVGKCTWIPSWDFEVERADFVRARIFGQFAIQRHFIAKAVWWSGFGFLGSIGHVVDLRLCIFRVSENEVGED